MPPRARERLRQLVCALRRQRHRADEREREPPNGLVHEGAPSALASGFALRSRSSGRWSIRHAGGDECRRRLLGGLLLRFLERSLHAALAQCVSLAPRVLRLALLEDREQRRRDEDRRVRTGRDTDHQRECEVLQRVAAEQERAPTGSNVMNDVASDRRIVSHSEMLAIVANDDRRMIGMFSLMRSKMMIVS